MKGQPSFAGCVWSANLCKDRVRAHRFCMLLLAPWEDQYFMKQYEAQLWMIFLAFIEKTTSTIIKRLLFAVAGDKTEPNEAGLDEPWRTGEVTFIRDACGFWRFCWLCFLHLWLLKLLLPPAAPTLTWAWSGSSSLLRMDGTETLPNVPFERHTSETCSVGCMIHLIDVLHGFTASRHNTMDAHGALQPYPNCREVSIQSRDVVEVPTTSCSMFFYCTAPNQIDKELVEGNFVHFVGVKRTNGSSGAVRCNISSLAGSCGGGIPHDRCSLKVQCHATLQFTSCQPISWLLPIVTSYPNSWLTMSGHPGIPQYISSQFHGDSWSCLEDV